MHSLTLYFLGAARPLYLEAPDYDSACVQLFRAIESLEPAKRKQIEQWARYIHEQIGRMPSYAGVSCEHGALGLSWRPGPQDRDNARRYADMQGLFGLDYSDCVSRQIEGK